MSLPLWKSFSVAWGTPHLKKILGDFLKHKLMNMYLAEFAFCSIEPEKEENGA